MYNISEAKFYISLALKQRLSSRISLQCLASDFSSKLVRQTVNKIEKYLLFIFFLTSLRALSHYFLDSDLVLESTPKLFCLACTSPVAVVGFGLYKPKKLLSLLFFSTLRTP